MRGKTAKRLRNMAIGVTQPVNLLTTYVDVPKTAMISGYVLVDDVMTKKLVPVIRNITMLNQDCFRHNYQMIKASFLKWKRCP